MSPEPGNGSTPTTGIAAIPEPGSREPEQIRADIVRQRQQLGRNVAALRGRVRDLTDVRKQAREHQTELMIGAAAVGAVAAGVFLLKRRGDD